MCVAEGKRTGPRWLPKGYASWRHIWSGWIYPNAGRSPSGLMLDVIWEPSATAQAMTSQGHPAPDHSSCGKAGLALTLPYSPWEQILSLPPWLSSHPTAGTHAPGRGPSSHDLLLVASSGYRTTGAFDCLLLHRQDRVSAAGLTIHHEFLPTSHKKTIYLPCW